MAARRRATPFDGAAVAENRPHAGIKRDKNRLTRPDSGSLSNSEHHLLSERSRHPQKSTSVLVVLTGRTQTRF